MCLLSDVMDYVNFVKASNYTQVTPLIRLSMALLQPQVEASNVWKVLVRLLYDHRLAAVCDEVIYFKRH
jgi:hypothetical protein